MLAEATLDIRLARGAHAEADVRVPENARGVIAFLEGSDEMAAACNDRGFATVLMDLFAGDERVEALAGRFATAVSAVTFDRFLRDRPVGYFGAGTGGAAALIAASLHTNEVAAVVALNAHTEVAAEHLSGVRAPTLLLVDDDERLAANRRARTTLMMQTSCDLHELPSGSPEVIRLTGDWFDAYLRGVMRGARRELWRSA